MATGKITLYLKVQDAHQKVTGDINTKDIVPLSSMCLLGFGYMISKPVPTRTPGDLCCFSLLGTGIIGMRHQPGSLLQVFQPLFFLDIKWSTINSHFSHCPRIFSNVLESLSPELQLPRHPPQTISFLMFAV